MANGIKIGTNSIGGVYIGSSSASSVYLGTTMIYSGGTPPTPPTPTGSTCYEVISTPITSYTSTTYDSVYSFSDSRWYMLNNLNGYEEYGVYDSTGSSLSDYTYYDGKLVAIGTTEYQRSGGTWVEVGTYEDESVTYSIDGRDPYAYEGQTLSTTFKIPVVDVETLGGVNFSIRDNNDGELNIMLAEGWTDYIYRDSEWNEYNGTVTNDGEYFYLSLPSEEPQSIIIEYINYDNSTPIHIIVSSQQASVEYSAKTTPISSVYSSVADMNSVGCPTVGVGQYGVVGNDTYQFDGEDWNSFSTYKLMEKNTDEKANVLLCNSSTELVKAEAQPSYFNNITDVVIGDCVTSISGESFRYCTGLTSCTIGNGVTTIGDYAFNGCSNLTTINTLNSVTSIGTQVFADCTSLTSCTIGSGVTNISRNAFDTCTSLTSVTVLATTPPTLGSNVFFNTNNCPIYVPSASVNAYKRATNWSTYASRITAIPNS